ncbi:MAG: cytochrome c-type biogenesis protein CcmH [Bryobacteraceae bacterium]
MRKLRNSFLLLVLAAVCLPQSATQLVTPEIRRVGDKLACRCGVCNNTVATCQMLECHYSLPSRQKIAAMQKEGKSDETILAAFVKEGGISALSSPPAEGFNLLGYVMPIFGVVIGLGAILIFLRRSRRLETPATVPPLNNEMLTRYRDRIDKDMAKLE